jgi:hypothetical protein
MDVPGGPFEAVAPVPDVSKSFTSNLPALRQMQPRCGPILKVGRRMH